MDDSLRNAVSEPAAIALLAAARDDGKLDLYAGGYAAFNSNSRRYCTLGSGDSSCPPSVYSGSPHVLYHNNGDGTFTNVTKASMAAGVICRRAIYEPTSDWERAPASKA